MVRVYISKFYFDLSKGTPIIAEGKVYDGLCQLYRDGHCKQQRFLSIDSSPLCNCQNNPGVLDPSFCGADGGCLCKPKFIGIDCKECIDNHFVENGECKECGCSLSGSYGKNCDEFGVCQCREGKFIKYEM